MKSIMSVTIPILIFAASASAQVFTFDEFIGTWQGTISSTTYGYSDPTTLVVQENGFYIDSSGRLMPTIYPDTQQCEFQGSTNRVHFWYLQTVYSGMYFYQHFYYEVVEYDGSYLEMHYNFWDDPEPHPEVQTIALTRQTTSLSSDRTWAGIKASFP
jgi:hypothetical protein